MKPYSLRRHLVMSMVAITTCVVLSLATLLYAVVYDAAWQQHDDGQRARARALAAVAEHDEDGYEMEIGPLPGSYLEVFAPGGSGVARSASMGNHTFAELRLEDSDTFVTRPLPDGRQGRFLVYKFLPRSEIGDPATLTMVLAESTEDVERAVAKIRLWFALLALFAVGATAIVAASIVKRALAPLPRLATSIDKIDDTSLDRRLSLDGQPAELVAPVNKLNELLERLQTSFTRERQFTADVGHELRTPLAGLRTLLEVTALSDRSTADYKAAVADAHAIVLQLGALVEDLLLLARLDAGQLPVANSEVDLAELAAECWRPHAALAASRSVELRTSIPAGTRITIDREKLRSVLGNLLANAAEYTTEGGWIEVSASDDALIAVTDSGPPIPPDQLDKIFDRLWRGDTSRTGTGLHCGIGLALARSLCAAMQLSLTAETHADGSVRFACRARVA